MPKVTIPANCIGPPTIAHGGYVAGLLLDGSPGATQITLRQPTPIETELELVRDQPGSAQLRRGDTVLVESQPAELTLEVPRVPSVDQARAAEAGSPSHWNGHGVHPTCFGCGLARNDEEGLEVAVGPCDHDGTEQVAAVWRPAARHADLDGGVAAQWVLAALDCPGAMAFIAREVSAGLLGRIVFEQFAPAPVDTDLVVTGWRVGTEGRKRFAGTALATGDGQVLAAAKAIWFGHN